MNDAQQFRVLVVIPAYNEEGRIGNVVRSVRAAMPDADTLVVSDESSDNTVAEARAAGAVVVPHTVNLGYGAALETGYVYAYDQGYGVVLQMDGDGQHLAEELPALMAPIAAGTADLVLGSRYLVNDANAGTPAIRRLGQVFFGALVNILTGLRLTDPTSGFQALNRRAIRFFASGVFPRDYPDADILMIAYLAGLRIHEVPARMLTRSGGTSMHSGLKPVYYVMKMLLSLFVAALNIRVWRRARRSMGAPDPANGGTGPQGG